MDNVGKNTPAKGNCTCRIMEVNTAFVWGAQKQAFEAGLWRNQRNALTKAPAWGELEAIRKSTVNQGKVVMQTSVHAVSFHESF